MSAKPMKRLLRDFSELSRIVEDCKAQAWPAKQLRSAWAGLPMANPENMCGARALSDMSPEETSELVKLVCGAGYTVLGRHWTEAKRWSVEVQSAQNGDCHAVTRSVIINMGYISVRYGELAVDSCELAVDSCDLAGQMAWFIRRGFKVFTRGNKRIHKKKDTL